MKQYDHHNIKNADEKENTFEWAANMQIIWIYFMLI
jgi:hypothetical protein